MCNRHRRSRGFTMFIWLDDLEKWHKVTSIMTVKRGPWPVWHNRSVTWFSSSAAFRDTNSISLSVQPWQVGAPQKRWQIGLNLQQPYTNSTPGYWVGPSPTSYDHHFRPNLGETTPSKNFNLKLWPNGARYKGGLYWQRIGIYDRPTQQ